MPIIDTAQRRTRVRGETCTQVIRLKLKDGMGNPKWVTANLLDASEGVIAISLLAPLAIRSKIVVRGKLEHRSEVENAATVMWCI
jgi:hypothetical protein